MANSVVNCALHHGFMRVAVSASGHQPKCSSATMHSATAIMENTKTTRFAEGGLRASLDMRSNQRGVTRAHHL